MEFNTSLFIGMWTIFYIQCNIPMAKAVVGIDVRPVRLGHLSYVVSIMNFHVFNSIPVYNHLCTAALISRSHVISAAVCFENRATNETKVHVGSLELSGGTKYDILWWLNYNDWTEYMEMPLEFPINDIGILKIDAEIHHIAPAIFLLTDKHYLDGKNALIVGWGRQVSREMSNRMLSVLLEFIPNDICEKKIQKASGKLITIPERYICTSAYHLALLQEGDYGGPLIHNDKIVGINKETLPYEDFPLREGNMNIHTGINYYKEFISHVTMESFDWHL